MLSENLILLTKKVIRGAVEVGIDEAGARICGPTAWKYVKATISPVVNKLERRFPKVFLESKEAEKAIEALSTDNKFELMLSNSFNSLESGKKEILDVLSQQSNTLSSIGKNVDGGFTELGKKIDNLQASIKPVPKKKPSGYIPTAEINERYVNIEYIEKRFIGREEELSKLSDFIERFPIVGIYGQPGVGKTTLALKWILNKSKEIKRKALWITITENFTSEEIIAKLLLDLKESRDFSFVQEKREALIQILSYSPILLLLDNCESLNEFEIEKVEQLVIELAKANCLCILTSRKKFEGEYIKGFELAPFTLGDAKKMLKTRAEDYDVRYLTNDEIERFCKAVENLPLAIEVLAPIIPSKPIATIIQDINIGHIDLVKRLIAAFEISYNNLPSEEIRKIFRCISVIPKDFSIEIIRDLNICLEENVSRALYELTSRCLIKLLPNNRYTMHAMTKTYALSKLKREEKIGVEARIIELYIHIGKQADLWNVSISETKSWQEKRRLFFSESSNIKILIDTLIQRKDKRVVPLIIANADTLTRIARRGFLQEAIEKVIEIFGEKLKFGGLNKLYAYLGSILHRQRDLDKAEEVLHKALRYSLDENIKDWRFAGFSCIWLGWIWIENSQKESDEKKRREKAMDWYRKAYNMAIEHNDNLIKVYAFHHFGHDLLWKAQNSGGSVRQKLIKETRETYEEVIRESEELGLFDRLCRTHSALAKLALNEGDYLTARYHACESEKIAQEINDARSEAVANAIYATCLLYEAKQRKQSNFETEATDLADKARIIALEGLNILQKLGDKGTSWQVYYEIGNIAAFQKQWEDAIWAYSNAFDRYVTSSGSNEISHIQDKIELSISNQNKGFNDNYNQIRLEGKKGLQDPNVLSKNHQRMEVYDHNGLTLVWGLPVKEEIQEIVKDIIELVKKEHPDKFIARQISCLHATILTMKKIRKGQNLADIKEWPFGIEEAFHDLIVKLEMQNPFDINFRGITISFRGEILLCGFPKDRGLSKLRGDLKRSHFWSPTPWHKDNFHISLGYFYQNLSSIEEIENLYKIFEPFEQKLVNVNIDRLKFVHFRNRNLTDNIGSIELPLGKPINLSSEQIFQYLHLNAN